MERALDCTDADQKQALLNIVIVGGGSYGCRNSRSPFRDEALHHSRRLSRLADHEVNIYLIEGSSRLLNVMSEEASAHVYKFLTEMEINIITEIHVTDYVDGKVIMMGKP